MIKKIVVTILKIIIFFIGADLLCVFIPLLDTDNSALWRLWAEITPLLAVITVIIIFWLIEKKKVKMNLFKNPIK